MPPGGRGVYLPGGERGERDEAISPGRGEGICAGVYAQCVSAGGYAPGGGTGTEVWAIPRGLALGAMPSALAPGVDRGE